MVMEAVTDIPISEPDQDALYADAVAQFGASLARLATAYEMDRSRQQDLLQDIHVALWRSFATFKGQCSLRTWVYRIAHNRASSYVRERVRMRRVTTVSLEEMDLEISQPDAERLVDHAAILEKLRALIQRLKPIDQEVFLLYLEGVDASGIAEIVGILPSNVAQKIHRVKKFLQQQFQTGDHHDQDG
jgi:RNA polymerase sigma-70 factor (ECF subfamily)